MLGKWRIIPCLIVMVSLFHFMNYIAGASPPEVLVRGKGMLNFVSVPWYQLALAECAMSLTNAVEVSQAMKTIQRPTELTSLLYSPYVPLSVISSSISQETSKRFYPRARKRVKS
jgi:hypothetical protein